MSTSSPIAAGDRPAEEVVVAERERIARGVGLFTVHRLFGIGLTLQALSLKQTDSTLSHDLDQCVGEIDLVIDDLRALVFDLDSRHGSGACAA